MGDFSGSEELPVIRAHPQASRGREPTGVRLVAFLYAFLLAGGIHAAHPDTSVPNSPVGVPSSPERGPFGRWGA